MAENHQVVRFNHVLLEHFVEIEAAFPDSKRLIVLFWSPQTGFLRA